MDLFTILFYQPIYNLLIVLYRLLGSDLGLAIIAIAILARLILYPITAKQIKMAESSRELNDKLKEVKRKYKNDKEKQNQEVLKLQSQYLPGQLSGCLSLIIQTIILLNVFHAITDLFHNGIASFNNIAYPFIPQFPAGTQLNFEFLGIGLAKVPAEIGFGNLSAIWPYLLLAVLVGISQYMSARILMGLRKTKDQAKPKDDKKKSKKVEPEDFAEIMQRSTQQTMMILPLLLVFTSLSFPAGVSLYWTVQSGLVIIQQVVLEKIRNRKKPYEAGTS